MARGQPLPSGLLPCLSKQVKTGSGDGLAVPRQDCVTLTPAVSICASGTAGLVKVALGCVPVQQPVAS